MSIWDAIGETFGEARAQSGAEDYHMTLVHFFMDETGIHDASPTGHIHIAGLLAVNSFWAVFNKQWSLVLNDEPRIRYWHTSKAHEIKTLDSTPRNMNEDEIDAKEMRLAEVLGDNNGCMVGFDVWLARADFDAHVRGKIKLPPKFAKIHPLIVSTIDKPEFLALRFAIHGGLKVAAKMNDAVRPGEPYQLWSMMEESESNWDREFNFLMSHHFLRRISTLDARVKVGPMIFAQSKGPLGMTPLQAADLYACNIQRSLALGKPSDPWREHLDKIKINRMQVTPEMMIDAVRSLNDGDRFDD